MSFIWIQTLWLISTIPVLVLIYVLMQRRRQKYALRYASLSLIKDAVGRGPGIRRHIPALLFIIGLTVMIFALARPAAYIILPSQQGTVILTVDVSGSMRADDIKPTRIEAAKAAARRFVEKQPDTVRIGVVSFSDNASIVQAPTRDKESAIAAINRLSPQRRTAIGSGILTSLDAIFEDNKATASQSPNNDQIENDPVFSPVAPGSYNSAVVVLLSDGASNTGPQPLDAAKVSSDRGVKVYTVGVGSPEGAILRTQGYSIRVRLDEETLKNTAARTDGAYFRADNEEDLIKIYENLSTRLVFKAEQTELTVFFTGAAALFLLAAGIFSLLWFNRLP